VGKVAVIQAGTVMFDTEATINKAVAYIEEAVEKGAELVVFPEAFVGGYPKASVFGAAVGLRTDNGRDQYARYASCAIDLHGPEVQRIVDASAEHSAAIVIGVIEKAGNTLYCTALHIHPEHGLVGNHRKLMPTGSERLLWGFGDGSTLDTMDTEIGRVGSVICWENYMPLLRQTMYAQGTEIYCAPTVDDRPQWQATMTHIALEGRVFVLSACQYITQDDFPEDHPIDIEPVTGHELIRGGSVIVDPSGTVLAGPVYGEETVLYADIDLSQKSRMHMDLDPVGHYARPDVFNLEVNTKPAGSVSFTRG